MLISALQQMIQLYIYTYPLFFRFSCHLGYRRILSESPVLYSRSRWPSTPHIKLRVCKIIHAYICIFYSFPLWFIMSHWIGSLCCPEGPRCISLPCEMAYICWSQPSTPSLPTSSPLPTTSLFSLSVSLFLFCRWVHLFHILDARYTWQNVVFVFLFLTDFT